MPTPAQSPVEHRVFLAVTMTGDLQGVIVPRGLDQAGADFVEMALSLIRSNPEKGRPAPWRRSPVLAKVWNMAEVHGRADWLVSLETLNRAAPVPFPRTTTLSIEDPA